MSGQSVSIKKIAAAVGLSRTTVSYVLSGKHQDVNISETTAEQVLTMASKMGYRPNFWARALVKRNSKLIGVLFPDLSGSAAHEITLGIEDVLGKNGYEAILAVSFWNPKKERREVEMMLEKQVAGIISLPQPGSELTYQMPLQSDCPVVFVGDYLPKTPASSVTLDTEDAIQKLLNHLHQLGYRKIHLLTIDYPSTTLLDREKAFTTALARLRMDGGLKSVSYAELGSEPSVYREVRDIMARSDRPDALVCISDSIAMMALSELARLNIAIPRDLAVAGIGNLNMTDHPFFGLTTVDECRRELGRRAAELILRLTEVDPLSEITPEHIRIKGPLIVRPSTVAGNRFNLINNKHGEKSYE